KYVKYFKFWFFLTRVFFIEILKFRKYDSIIFVAPLTVMWPGVILQKLLRANKRIVVIFDLFPRHQVLSGSIPVLLDKILHKIEMYLVNSFDLATAMGPNNKRFIKNYYKISDVVILPFWSAKKICSVDKIRDQKVRMVFGGQIVEGRDLEPLIKLLEIITANISIEFDIYSSGDMFEELEKKYGYLSWISFNPVLPRNEYQDLISKYDVGVVVTDERVNLPTFPSKTIDYISCGLFCFCLVEEVSELDFLKGETDLIHINNFNYDEQSIGYAVNFFKSILISDQKFDGQQLDIISRFDKANTSILRNL
ncbi:hypothetical protein AB4381_12170, partial [Vibrio splendidus]